MFFDPLYLLFVGPGLLLALWAQWKVKSTFARFAQVPTRSGITGAEAAEALIRNFAPVPARRALRIESIPGHLSDHYDPRTKTLALSESSQWNSVASVAVVAHEFGHALQDAEGYAPLRLRGAIVPAVQVGGWVAPLMFLAGLWLRSPELAWIGVLGFFLAAAFALVTLPVEFDASRRALVVLEQSRLLAGPELTGAKQVLDAAALTYVAAAAQALLTLLYYVSLLTGMRRSDD